MQMLSDFIAKKLFSYEASCDSSSKISDKLIRIGHGLMSFPLNVPGTTYHRCLKVINRLYMEQPYSYMPEWIFKIEKKKSKFGCFL